MDRGTGGGCSLPRTYRSFGHLTEAELQSLVVSSTKLLSDLGLRRASESAILKLLAALPMTTRQQVENVAARVYIDTLSWNRREDTVTCMEVVQKAVLAEKQVRFRYRKKDDLSSRTVGALGLVCKGSTWYLVGESGNNIKSYRLSRIEDAEMLEIDAKRPKDFRLEEFWRQSVASLPTRLPRYPVVLSCQSEYVPQLHRAGHWSSVQNVGEVNSEGWCRVSMRFERDVEALQCILEHCRDVKVVEPDDLRQQVISALEEALSLYRTTPDADKSC